MKIYLTAPYDPNGIEEIDTIGAPDGDVFSWVDRGTFRTSFYWFTEGVTWHRTKKAAIKAAKRFRVKWIKEVTTRASEITSLPPVC